MTEEKREPGRPRLYDDADEFAAKVDAYFEQIELKGRPPTVAGLAYYLGFSDRHSIAEYAKYDGFSATVSRAKLRIEQDRAERLASKDEYTPGLPMDLRVNHGWQDANRLEITGPGGGPVTTITREMSAQEAQEAYAATLRDQGE